MKNKDTEFIFDQFIFKLNPLSTLDAIVISFKYKDEKRIIEKQIVETFIYLPKYDSIRTEFELISKEEMAVTRKNSLFIYEPIIAKKTKYYFWLMGRGNRLLSIYSQSKRNFKRK